MPRRTTPEPRPPGRLITLQEAADRLGVHYMTAYRYVRTGRLPATRSGAHWLVDSRDLSAVGAGAGTPGRHPAADHVTTPGALVRRLESRLVAGDEAGAWTIVESSLGAGNAPDILLVDLLGAAMRLVGDRWATGDYTVDDEHRATGVAQRLVARLGPLFAKRGPKRRSVILGTPPHELHGLPTAMAANVLRGRGYEVIDLGADVPVDVFAIAVAKATRRPSAVGLVVSSGDHDRSVRAIVRAVHRVAPGLTVLVGGSAIEDAVHAAGLDAAWSGVDARGLADVIEGLESARGG
jgi:excisionase family DNA binding protein